MLRDSIKGVSGGCFVLVNKWCYVQPAFTYNSGPTDFFEMRGIFEEPIHASSTNEQMITFCENKKCKCKCRNMKGTTSSACLFMRKTNRYNSLSLLHTWPHTSTNSYSMLTLSLTHSVTRLIWQYLAIYTNENLPNSKLNSPKSDQNLPRRVQNFAKNRIDPIKIEGLLKFCQGGKFLPNLVTLAHTTTCTLCIQSVKTSQSLTHSLSCKQFFTPWSSPVSKRSYWLALIFIFKAPLPP